MRVPRCRGCCPMLFAGRRAGFKVAAAGCCWLLLAASGCCWLLLAAPGCCWLLLAASGCLWLLLDVCADATERESTLLAGGCIQTACEVSSADPFAQRCFARCKRTQINSTRCDSAGECIQTACEVSSLAGVHGYVLSYRPRAGSWEWVETHGDRLC